LHSITLTLDIFARYYYGKEETVNRTLFEKWISSYEYLHWKESRDTIFSIGSITEYYYQLAVVQSIWECIDGILGDDKAHKAHVNGSPLLYYLGTGTTYDSRDTLTLVAYFSLKKKKLLDIVKLMVKYSETLLDRTKVHNELCIYLMENIVNCDYAYAQNDNMHILSLTNNQHQVITMFGRDADICRDYWMEKDIPCDTPPPRTPASPPDYFLPLPPEHVLVQFGDVMVVTNPYLTQSPHGTIYASMRQCSRSHAKMVKKQQEAANVKTNPPSQPGK
jgi:hypothetical protein